MVIKINKRFSIESDNLKGMTKERFIESLQHVDVGADLAQVWEKIKVFAGEEKVKSFQERLDEKIEKKKKKTFQERLDEKIEERKKK